VSRLWVLMMLFYGMSVITPVNAVTPEQVDAAVADILFENEADEFASYSVDEDGGAEVTFANNTPDDIYNKIVRALKSHKDIEDVLPGRGGPACSLF